MYQVKIIADVIDPSDPAYLKANDAVLRASLNFGCERSIEYMGNIEVGVFTFPDKDACLRFRDCYEHVAAMKSVLRFYRSMKIERMDIREITGVGL